MENLSRYLDINRTLTLICCFSCIFLQAEGSSTSWMVGSTVTLHCSNKSISDLVQLTWRRNGTCLFSFRPRKTSNSRSVTLSSKQKTSDSRIRTFPAAAPLNLNMSTLESQLYALIIERAQKSHTGNYTCETTTDFGVFEQKWELIITEEAGNTLKIHIAAIIVPCVCFLIFIISALTFLRQLCKKQPENITQSPTVTSQKHIYENPLELEARRQRLQILVLPYTKSTER